MDALTHIFLPLTLLFVARRKFFSPHPSTFFIALFALLPDLDKYLGMPGLLHSLVTLIPITLAIFLIEKITRGRKTYSAMIGFFIFSHLLLDFIAGHPVTLLHPFSNVGVGVRYPIEIVFGEGFLRATLRGAPIEVFKEVPRPGFNTYGGLISGFGVSSLFLFAVILLQRKWEG